MTAEAAAHLLQCPTDGARLQSSAGVWLCPDCGAGYPVTDGYVDFGELAREGEEELLEYYENEHPGCNPQMHEWKVAELLGVVGELRARAVLDAGCGLGEILRSVAGHVGAEVTVGVEWSRPMLRAAAGLPDAGREAHWLRANVNSMPVCDGSADLVLAVDIIEHVTDPAHFLREARRVGNRLAAKVPLGGRLRPWRRNFGHLHRFTLADCRALLSDTGWEVVRERFPAQPVQPKAEKGKLYNALYVARRTLNQRLRQLLRRPRWYLVYAVRKG